MIRALLFDMDGVVLDSEKLYKKALVRFFARLNVQVPDEDWKLFRGSTESAFYRQAMDRYQLKGTFEELRRTGRREVVKVFEQELDYMAGFQALMDRLDGQYITGLVTSTPDDLYRSMAVQTGIEQYFKAVLTGDMTAHHKPHPEPYQKMMELLAVTPAESMVVEDSIHGIAAGLACGAVTVALTGSVPVADMPPAHAVIESLDEITDEFIQNLAQKAAPHPA